MNKAARSLLIIGSIWIFLVCGCAFFSLSRPGIATKWKQEHPPPEPFSALGLGEVGEVLAETPNGALYEYGYASKQRWEKVTQPSGNPALGYDCTPGESNRLVLPPPGKIVSIVKETCVYAESAYYLEVALLESGEVWSWEHESYAYTSLALLSILFIASVIGALILLLGLGLWIFWKNKEKT